MCGIFGIVNHDSAAYITYLGLRRMQSRGQESAGIVSAGQELLGFREVGLVKDIITEKTIQSLPGSMAIGHVRYSTSGESSVKEAQPFLVDTRHGQLAVC
ncbi:MAG TPA: amidophosphoribosyltransferase, partial [Verrucomicrobiae bacterium]|nr:amidophosphoribosyltransferase [Verrucomicrobiae bacterium]